MQIRALERFLIKGAEDKVKSAMKARQAVRVAVILNHAIFRFIVMLTVRAHAEPTASDDWNFQKAIKLLSKKKVLKELAHRGPGHVALVESAIDNWRAINIDAALKEIKTYRNKEVAHLGALSKLPSFWDTIRISLATADVIEDIASLIISDIKPDNLRRRARLLEISVDDFWSTFVSGAGKRP